VAPASRSLVRRLTLSQSTWTQAVGPSAATNVEDSYSPARKLSRRSNDVAAAPSESLQREPKFTMRGTRVPGTSCLRTPFPETVFV
jgi:hypothetical protein